MFVIPHTTRERKPQTQCRRTIYVYGASTRQLGVLMFESPNYGTLRLVEHKAYTKAAGGG